MNSVTVEVTGRIDVQPRCNECGEDLGGEFDKDSGLLYINPCQTCIANELAAAEG